MVITPSRIKQIAREKGISQNQVARLSGIDPSNISAIARGTCDPRRSTMLRIAKALGVTLDVLFWDEAA